MNPILDSDKAKVYYDGIFSNPRLQHPEGVALDDEGYVYCGTENGEIMKIEKDWVSNEQGSSLYLRPFIFSSSEMLAASPSLDYKFLIICSPGTS